MGNHISSDQIARRLGGSGSSGQRFGAEPEYQHDDKGGGSSVVLYMSMFCTFAAIGLGTFIFMGGELPIPSFSSGKSTETAALIPGEAVPMVTSLDKTCLKGWQTGLPNYDQIHCLLTTDPTRLCKPKGREELMVRLAYFNKDFKSYQVAVGLQEAKQAMGMIAGGGVKIAIEEAKMSAAMRNPKLTEAEKEKISMDFFKTVGEVTTTKDDIRKQVKSKVGEKGFIKAVSEVLRRGYMKVEDFGTPTPFYVKRAAEELEAVYDYCPKRS